MRLYSTVTSERASKGQGGNLYIEIEIKDEQQKVIYSMSIMPHPEGYSLITNNSAYVSKRHGGGYEIDILKAREELKKQKAISKK